MNLTFGTRSLILAAALTLPTTPSLALDLETACNSSITLAETAMTLATTEINDLLADIFIFSQEFNQWADLFVITHGSPIACEPYMDEIDEHWGLAYSHLSVVLAESRDMQAYLDDMYDYRTQALNTQLWHPDWYYGYCVQTYNDELYPLVPGPYDENDFVGAYTRLSEAIDDIETYIELARDAGADLVSCLDNQEPEEEEEE